MGFYDVYTAGDGNYYIGTASYDRYSLEEVIEKLIEKQKTSTREVNNIDVYGATPEEAIKIREIIDNHGGKIYYEK